MPHSLLLVHASRDDREMYAEYLTAHGFRVLEAATTDAALPLSGSADLVITGLMVEGSVDAIELIATMRQDPLTARTPVIVVTGCTLSPQLERARRAGADLVLLKPCLPDVLLAEVRRVLNTGQPRPNRGTIAVDRRHIPDRRAEWRGGRRDSDWVGKPRTAPTSDGYAARRWPWGSRGPGD